MLQRAPSLITRQTLPIFIAYENRGVFCTTVDAYDPNVLQ